MKVEICISVDEECLAFVDRLKDQKHCSRSYVINDIIRKRGKL